MTDLTFSPRVVGTNRPDFYSIETMLNSPPFKGKAGEALVLAIYDYFTSTVDGTYHFWPVDEKQGTPQIRVAVFDFAKLINAYGWMVCGQCSAFLYAIYRVAGLTTRQYGVPGHSLCEVFFDGRWHHLDVDMWTWFRTPEGHIASAVELTRNAHALIIENTNKSKPCNLPDRTLKDYAEMYAGTQLAGDEVHGVIPPWLTRAHTMDFQLRPGETLIRSQSHQGRFHMPQEWLKMKLKYPGEWHGHPVERYEPFRTFGNGRWIYEPKLSAPHRDLDAGAWERNGLTQDAHGLLGAGSITFRILSPYPFCSKPDFSTEKVTYSDGVYLDIASTGAVTVEVTTPEGGWEALQGRGRTAKGIDISTLLEARYECLIRVTLAAGARLSRFRFDGFIMTAPQALPRLTEGANAMEIRSNDKHGLRTVPYRKLIDFRGASDLVSQFASIEDAELKPYAGSWRQIAALANGATPATAVVRFPAPAGKTFAWVYAHASIFEAPTGVAGFTASLEWSVDGKNWTPLSTIPVTCSRQTWDCSIDGEFMADAVKEVWIRITAGTGITAMELHGHLNAPHPSEGNVLRVTHQWEDDRGRHSFEAPPGATTYTVTCGKNPRAHTIVMEVR